MNDEILMQSIVNQDLLPMVQVKWGDNKGQLTPEAAREHALHMLECAEAAIYDASLVRFLMGELDIEFEAAHQMLYGLRKFRGDSTREDWRGQ